VDLTLTDSLSRGAIPIQTLNEIIVAYRQVLKGLMGLPYLISSIPEVGGPKYLYIKPRG